LAVEILSNNDGILDCQKCDERLREERGHDKEGIVPFWVQGKVIKRCPLTLITPLSYEYIKAFSFYDKAHHVKGFISDNDFFMLKADFKKRLDDFNKLIKDEKQVYVYLKGDSDLLFSNIKSRNRTSLLHESDVNYLNLIVNEFESVIKSKAVVIELKDSYDYGLAVRKVEGLVNENSNF